MARAKKGRVGTAENSTPKKIYSAGIYARLSVDSDERKNESIETQIEIAGQFIRQQADMELYGSYTDLGRTGTNFEREGFEQMMRDVRTRKIDCIVVKDLSRFGRNHIEAGNYIEKIFPFLGVRFVAVTDKFDSLSASGKDEAFGVNLKNLVNEMYARDIGAKVRSSKKAKWEQGSYTGGVPPYGYRAKWVGDKKRLFPDYPAADIVKKIFDLFISGSNMKEIALWLYHHKIVRPAEYHKTGQPYCQEGGSLEQWPRGTVKMVLTNPVYMGCLVQGKSCGGNGRHGMEAFGWSVNGHTHEAIISEGLFFKAAARFEELAVYCNQKGYSKRVPLEPDIFADILYCGDCGCKMKRITAVKELRCKGRVRAYSYHCPNASRIDANKCMAKSITLHALGNIVKEAARMETIVCEVQPKGIAELQSQELEKAKEKWEEGLLELDKELETIAKAGSEQYMKYRMGGIDADTFQRIKGEHNRKIISNQAKRADIEGKLRAVGEGKAPQKDLLQILEGQNGADGPPPELIQALVQRIEVYPSHRVKVVFAFHKDSASFAGGRLFQMANYQVAAYLRLSKEDHKGKSESNSITAQRALLRKFAAENFSNYDLLEFCDDGYTGTNFERPGMRQLLECVKSSKVDCVLVKDFSRFARDYIALGSYLEQIFPFMGVRFISVNDNYDSEACQGRVTDIDINFKNLLYDLYSKDLSQKVRASLAVKKGQGKYVSANSPFGYEKDPKDRHALLVAEDEAEIVRRIFALTLEGYTSVEIARLFNQALVKTPIEFKIEKGRTSREPKGGRFLWGSSTICQILRNEVYIGNIAQNKYKKDFVGGKNHLTPREEWAISYSHHKPIIDREAFYKVQKMRGRKRGRQHMPSHPLTGILVCGCCNRNLRFRTGLNPYFTCHNRYTNAMGQCVGKVNAMLLEQYVLFEMQGKIQESIKRGGDPGNPGAGVQFAELSKEMLNCYIDKILVYGERQIEICWKGKGNTVE